MCEHERSLELAGLLNAKCDRDDGLLSLSHPVADAVPLDEAAYSVRMPMMLKGPTGCGKTRFVEYMA